MPTSVEVYKLGDSVPTPSKPPPEQKITASWKGDIHKPLVSIICHTYQHASYIKDALDSFLMQKTDFPFEIIVHDDASQDGTAEIVKAYQSEYPYIIKPILQDINQYQYGIRPNKVTLPKAKGQYIAFCEGDDYWTDENKISIQASFLNKHMDVAVAYHDAIKVVHGKMTGCLLGEQNKRNYSNQEVCKAPFIPTLTRMVRNVEIAWKNEGSFPIAGDICMLSYLGRIGGAKYIPSIAPSVYRLHDEGIWSSISKPEKLRVTVDALLFIATRYDKEGNFELRDYFIQRASSEIASNLSMQRGRFSKTKKIISFFNKRWLKA